MGGIKAGRDHRPPAILVGVFAVVTAVIWASGAWVLTLSRPGSQATNAPNSESAPATATPNPPPSASTTSPMPPPATPPAPSTSATPAPSTTAPVWSGPAAKDGGYTVMSYNITDASRTPSYAGMADHPDAFSWETRGPLVASWITTVSPDLLGLQEVNPVLGGGEQVDVLRKSLPGYTWVNPQRTTALAFRTRTFTLLDTGVIRVSRKGKDGSSYDRYAPWVKLRTTAGKHLLFVNLHAEYGQTKIKAKARSAGWKHLIAGLRKVNPGRKLPVIVTGDFNASSAETRPIFRDHLIALKGAGLTNAARVAVHRPTRIAGVTSFNGFGAVVNGAWHYRAIRRDEEGANLDYVWVGGGAKALAWQVYLGPQVLWRVTDGRLVPYAPVIPSDHWPVLAKVKLS
jgi:endonuclease/exonuclease/phosphatase family metal-dependent hydrolase